MATEPLATVEPPKLPATGKRIGFQEAMGIQQPYLQRKRELLPKISEAEGGIAQAKQAQAETLATGKEQAMHQFAGAERGAKEAYQQKLEAEPLPAFVPTQDTVQDIAGLFSLIGVIGMVAGKGNAMQAMNAMNGMLEGHRAGRKDLYQQERQTFEKNFQSMLKKHEEFRKEMEDAVKLAATDRDAGMQAAELAAVKAGSPIVQAQLRKGQLMDAYKFVEESQQGVENALGMEAKARQAEAAERAAAQRHRENLEFQAEQREFDRQLRRDMALLQSEKLSPTEKKEVRGIVNLGDEISRLAKTFKPEYANFKMDVAGDVSAKLQERFMDNPEMAEWWRRYENVAIPERHSMFGATLTGGERESWRKASIGPGNSTKQIESWLLDKQTTLQNKMKGFEGKATTAGPSTPTPPSGPSISTEDQQALNWANSNPGDPRAVQIKQRLGVQ